MKGLTWKKILVALMALSIVVCGNAFAQDDEEEYTLVPVDIKPGGCPNKINVRSQGVLPTAVLGTDTLDVRNIDPASITLEGISPLRWNYEDVATPFEPYEGKTVPSDCSSDGPDGYEDLTLKFSTQELVTELGDVKNGDVVVLTLTGVLMDGTPIQGEEVIVIKAKKEKKDKKDKK